MSYFYKYIKYKNKYLLLSNQIGNGVDINRTINDNSETILHFVTNNNKINKVKQLLKHPDINVNSQNINGDTPLNYAIYNNYIGIIKLLLNHPNINVNIKNINDETALYYAIEQNNIKIIKLLLEHKNININIQNKYGDTPLHYAVQEKNYILIYILLLQKNINTNIKNNLGIKPLNTDIKNKLYKIIKILSTDKHYKIESKLSLYNTTSYKIDDDNKNKWLENQCYNNARILGKFILDITKHVPYKEFHDNLNLCFNKIPTNLDYVICIPMDVENITNQKSNIWITSILLDKINKKELLNINIKNILYSTDDNYYALIYLYSLLNINFLIFDDGSFSGSQMEADINNIYYNMVYDKSKIFCIIPYMSNNAIKLLNNINNIYIKIIYIEIIETVTERCNKLNIKSLNLVNTNRELQTFNINNSQTLNKLLNEFFPNLRNNFKYNIVNRNMPFYFDHKIADYVSTFPIIYQYGYVRPSSKCKEKSIPLIANCENIPTLESLNKKIYNEQCIIPYYKKLDIKIINI